MSPQKRGMEPEILETMGLQWTQKFIARRAKNTGASFYWPAMPVAARMKRRERLNHRLLPLLKTQADGCCSFCGKRPVERESIEHHRPKSTFPDWAYAWENLLYCCAMCQDRKLEKWHPALLKPDEPGYRFERYFQWNFRDGTLEPNAAASLEDRRAAQLTICLYNLNASEHRLCRRRARKYWLQGGQGSSELADADHPYFITAEE
jgi:uncharacterized protein (TIGR02646 family)